MISDHLFRRYYPASAHDGTRAFYGWLREYVSRSTRVLNVGAGPATQSSTRTLKGEAAAVVGIDIDPIVLGNPELDEALVIKAGRFPVDDQMFDVAFADNVLEHIENPIAFLSEVQRVLKPGGSFFFRTPNRYHYVAAISALTPHKFHLAVANRVRGMASDAHEPWQTRYRLNTRRAIRRASAQAGLDCAELRLFEAQPSYLVFNSAAFLIGVAYERLVNRFKSLAFMRANIFGRLVRAA